jgi:hypothetical protein
VSLVQIQSPLLASLPDPEQSGLLACLALLAPLAVCINLYGLAYRGAFEPLDSFRFSCISEWWPLWQLTQLPIHEVTVQFLLLALALAPWLANPQRRWAHLSWLLVLAALYARANRNVWLLSLTSLMVLAANSAALVPERLWHLTTGQRPSKSLSLIPGPIRWAVRVGAVAWLWMQIASHVIVLASWHGDYRPLTLDRGLISFLHKHQLAGRMFNDFENSRYLEYQVARQAPLFIEVQMAYPDQLMRDYLDILNGNARSRQLLDEYDIGYVILTVEREGPALGVLARWLDTDQRWKRVYAGPDAILWVRRTAEYQYLWADPDLIVSSEAFGGNYAWLKSHVGPHTRFDNAP